MSPFGPGGLLEACASIRSSCISACNLTENWG